MTVPILDRQILKWVYNGCILVKKKQNIYISVLQDAHASKIIIVSKETTCHNIWSKWIVDRGCDKPL